MNWKGSILVVVVFTALIATGIAAHGCAGIQRAWPGFVECVTHSGHPVDEVSFALQRDGTATELSAESKLQLEKLAATWGADVIACIIEQLIEAWVPEGPASADPGRLAASRRAQDFLNMKNSHPVMHEHFLVRNSWGTGWGDSGYCTMPFEYVCDPELASDFWVGSAIT